MTSTGGGRSQAGVPTRAGRLSLVPWGAPGQCVGPWHLKQLGGSALGSGTLTWCMPRSLLGAVDSGLEGTVGGEDGSLPLAFSGVLRKPRGRV